MSDICFICPSVFLVFVYSYLFLYVYVCLVFVYVLYLCMSCICICLKGVTDRRQTVLVCGGRYLFIAKTEGADISFGPKPADLTESKNGAIWIVSCLTRKFPCYLL